MSEHNNQFLPEHVDEQVEALSLPQMGMEHGSSASARLVAHLHQVYQEEAEIGEQVWARLTRYAGERHEHVTPTPEGLALALGSPNAAGSQLVQVNQQRLFSTSSGETLSMNPTDQQTTQPFPLQSGPRPSQEARLRPEMVSGMPRKESISTPRKRLSRFLGLVAAVVVGAVLISSVALVFTLSKGRAPNTGTGSSTPTVTVKATPTTATSSKTIVVQQTRTNRGASLTLDHLILTESTVTAYFTSLSPATEDTNSGLVIRSLSINGQPLPTFLAGSSGYWKGPGTFIVPIHEALLNHPGVWSMPVQLTLGLPGGGTTFRAGWTFSFTVQE